MTIDVNELGAQQLQLEKAKEQAALNERAGTLKIIKAARILGWLCALLPIVGIFGIGLLAGFVPLVGFIYLATQGATRYAVKQILISFLAGVAATIVWLIWNMIVIAMFG